MISADPTHAAHLTHILSRAAECMPEHEWRGIAADVCFLLRNQHLQTARPALYALLQDTPAMTGVEAGARFARMLSRAASAMRPSERLALWHELWVLLKDERPLPAELAAAINTLPYDEEWI